MFAGVVLLVFETDGRDGTGGGGEIAVLLKGRGLKELNPVGAKLHS